MTENDLQFICQEFQEFLQKNGVVHVKVGPYHPSSNGLAERAVQTFTHALRHDKTGHLDQRLYYRLTPHSTTGQSPAEILLGRRPRSHLNLLHPDTMQRVLHKQSNQGRDTRRKTQVRRFREVVGGRCRECGIAHHTRNTYHTTCQHVLTANI